MTEPWVDDTFFSDMGFTSVCEYDEMEAAIKGPYSGDEHGRGVSSKMEEGFPGDGGTLIVRDRNGEFLVAIPDDETRREVLQALADQVDRDELYDPDNEDQAFERAMDNPNA